MTKIFLRKFPYPYKAGMAICSDIDGTSFDNFLQIHCFLNSDKHSTLGRGLNLPIADSFWMYDQPDATDSAFSYFDMHGKETSHAPFIREMIRAGICDVMHSYGNFSHTADFSRYLAANARDELDKHDLKIKRGKTCFIPLQDNS